MDDSSSAAAQPDHRDDEGRGDPTPSEKARAWATTALGPWAQDIAQHVAQYRERRASVPADRVVVADLDEGAYVCALGDTAGAARITCPSLDAAYVVHDALVIADHLLNRGVSALRLERAAVKASDAIRRATPHTAAVRYYASQQDGELASEVGHRIWYLSDCALVKTPEGDIIATSGDWIIRDARGDLYVLPHQDVGARRAATSDRPRTALEQFGDAVYNLGQPAGGWSALADKLEAEAAAVNTGDPIADLAKRSTLRDRAAVCRDWGARVYQVMGQRRAVDVGPTRRILVDGIPVEVGVALPVEDLPPPAPSDRPALTTALSEIGRLVGLAAPEDRTDQEAWNVYGNQVGEAVKARVAPVVGDAISLPVSCEYIDNGDTITASIFDADGIYLAGLLPLDVVGVSDRKDPQAEELVARLNATYTAGARVAGDDHFDLVVKNMTADDLQRAQAAVREVASDLQASVTAGMPLEQARAMLGQAREDERQPDIGGVEGEDAGGDPGVG